MKSRIEEVTTFKGEKMYMVVNELITIEGMRKLEELKNLGEELPENWKTSVMHYLKLKQHFYDQKKEDLESDKEQMKEALKICRRLGLIWIFKF